MNASVDHPRPVPGAIDPEVGTLEGAVKSEAARLKFAFCGITTAETPPHHAEYRQWLADGFAGEMDYLERHEPAKGRPGSLIAGAASIIAVGLNYTPADESAEACAQSSGVIARYARFDDYHETIWSRLELLLAFLRSRSPGCSGKVYCDTGPVSERDLAMRAGLGWIGKHTNLINRKLGNWFFLGFIVTNAALAPDVAETPHCGTCTRCLPACPTGAIVAPYRLDARRCISYLTIELKGSIPVELRSLVGNRIYGCDDCLAVCPWNKFAVISDDPAVRPRADLSQPDLVELLTLTDEQFADRFAHSPIRRTRRRGLARNVCVALGNVGDASALPALISARDTDAEPLVREHAAWAIEQIQARLAGLGAPSTTTL